MSNKSASHLIAKRQGAPGEFLLEQAGVEQALIWKLHSTELCRLFMLKRLNIQNIWVFGVV